jgi:HK97 family phage portal protein
MLRNIRRSVFSGVQPASGGNREQVTPQNSVPILPILPIGKNLPEKRSQSEEVGDLLSGKIVQILGDPAASGSKVNENTSLTVAAVTACVSLIADMVAKLPVYLYEPSTNGPKQIKNHAAIRLIGRNPSELHTSFELRQLMETGKGLGGNGYARVFRDATYTPRAIEWLAPCDVQPKMVKRATGERFAAYKVAGESGLLNRQDILHVRQLSKDGILGMSPVSLMRDSIGTAMSQTTAAGKLMKNGAKFPGFLVSSANLKKEIIDDARTEFNSKYASAQNAGSIPVLNGMFDFKQTNGMSMVDAQFIESRRFELQEIARIYRVPPFMIGDSTASNWGTGIEQQTLGFLNFCLDPHLVGWEQSLAHTLLTTEEQDAGLYFKFDRDELANVALEARANFFKAMREMKVFSPNDVRSELGYESLPEGQGGDEYTNPTIAEAATPNALATN